MSIVSVSRFAGPPQLGQSTLTQSSAAASGERPFGRNSSTSGSTTGSWSSGTGTRPQPLAVDDRDRAAPVALAREQPVAQAVADGRLRLAALGERVDDRLLRLRCRQAVEAVRVDEHLVLGVRGVRAGLGRLAVGGLHDSPDRQPVLDGEVVVALVVRGNGHDRARPVPHQHVVGDPDRDLLAVDGVDRVAAREDAVLLLLLALDRRARAGMAHVLAHLLGVGQLRDERVLGRQHEEGGAEERVRPGREDRHLLTGSRRHGRSRAHPRSGRSSCAASSARAPASARACPSRRAAHRRSR